MEIRNALQCRICLDSVNNNWHVSSCCGNLFHHTCAYRVRSTAKRNHHPSLCPTCRASHFCGDGNNLLKLGWMDDVYHQIASALGETLSIDRMRRELASSDHDTGCLIDPVENADPSIRAGRYMADPPVCKVHCPFIPLRKEIHKKRMEVYYNAVDDTYHRPLCNVKNQGWRSCVWKYCNIERKSEDSWQMVYLGRENGSDDSRGYIEWRFNLKEVGLKIKKLKIAVPYVTLDSGEVKITLISRSPNAQIIFVGSETNNLHGVRDACGWDDFVIRVELPGLRNEGTSSQSSQLFRQFLPDVNSGTENTFRVIIDMCGSL